MRVSDIYIVESLTGGFSRRTGSRLFETLEPLAKLSKRPVDVHQQWITTRQGLIEYLDVVATEARARRRSPLLHLETHGSPHGLHLASNELVTWRELRAPLAAVNEAGRLNLVVLVAACNGLDLLKILEPTDRAPARLIIGPNRDLKDFEVEAANLAFYRTLFETFDGVLAYNAMNDAIEQPSEARTLLFHAMTAEIMFQWVMREYFRTKCTPKDVSARIEAKVAPLALTGHSPRFLAAMREGMRAALTDHRALFDYYRRLFFFCDVQPENSARFDIPFETCWPEE